jgi:uncharacterized protein YkwD
VATLADMTRILLSLILGLVATLAVTGSASAAGPYDKYLAPTNQCTPQLDRNASVDAQEKAMACMVNYARKAAGVTPALITNTSLTTSADRKAGDILTCQQFSHTACVRAFTYHMQQVGYATGCYGAGENIAWGSGSYGTVRSMMSGWLNSTGHRQNILNPRFRDQGLGLRVGTMSGYKGAAVWVNQFGYRC